MGQASAEWVASMLRERIIRGDLAPGARIVERSLSAELDVSRTPVREALKLLRADGLVEISKHRGAIVASYTAHEAKGLFDLIAAIEGLAAERLAERLTPKLLDPLEDMHRHMRDRFVAGESALYFKINTDIHNYIVAHSANAFLQESHERMMIRAQRGRYRAILDPHRWQQAMDEHDALMEALRGRDELLAGTIWRTHLGHTGDALAETLGKHDG